MGSHLARGHVLLISVWSFLGPYYVHQGSSECQSEYFSDSKLQNKIESQTDQEERPSPKKEIRKRKDFAEAALNKRQVSTMAEILEQASKNKQ